MEGTEAEVVDSYWDRLLVGTDIVKEAYWVQMSYAFTVELHSGEQELSLLTKAFPDDCIGESNHTSFTIVRNV
jgi:hypothetical protein